VTRSLAAKASLPADSQFVPGKGVMATIAGTGRVSGVSLPASAVTHVGDHDEVFVRSATDFVRHGDGGRADRRPRLPVGGCQPGSQIAISGVAELKSLGSGQ
jgi:cobalt-zinc-cadmium efflux system membrane fusion protein